MQIVRAADGHIVASVSTVERKLRDVLTVRADKVCPPPLPHGPPPLLRLLLSPQNSPRDLMWLCNSAAMLKAISCPLVSYDKHAVYKIIGLSTNSEHGVTRKLHLSIYQWSPRVTRFDSKHNTKQGFAL